QGADDPLGGGGVQVQVVVAGEEAAEEVQVLGPAAHVGRDPGGGEAVHHALQAGVVVGLGAVFGGVGVFGGEPGIGVGDVGHEHHAQFGGEFGRADAPGGAEGDDVGGVATDNV